MLQKRILFLERLRRGKGSEGSAWEWMQRPWCGLRAAFHSIVSGLPAIFTGLTILPGQRGDKLDPGLIGAEDLDSLDRMAIFITRIGIQLSGRRKRSRHPSHWQVS